MLNRPLIIDRGKAASYPLKPGVFYKCTVTFVDSSGRVKVSGSTFGLITPIGTTKLNKMKSGDTAICTFTDEFFKELIVFGHATISEDVFADRKKVAELEQTIKNLTSRIEALEA
jgi:hypothetical protein